MKIPHPSIPHETLRERLVKSEDVKVPVNDILKMAELFLKNNIFEFNWKVKQQVEAEVTSTKFASPHVLMHAFTWMR